MLVNCIVGEECGRSKMVDHFERDVALIILVDGHRYVEKLKLGCCVSSKRNYVFIYKRIYTATLKTKLPRRACPVLF